MIYLRKSVGALVALVVAAFAAFGYFRLFSIHRICDLTIAFRNFSRTEARKFSFVISPRVKLTNTHSTPCIASTSRFNVSNSARDTMLVSAIANSGNAAARANMSFFIVGCPLSLSVVGTPTLYHNQNGAIA